MNLEPKRIIMTIIGFFLLALSVALSIYSKMGTAVVSCVPYVYSLITGLSMGNCLIIFHSIYIFIQIFMLKKDFPPFQLLQMVMVFFFGKMTNFTISSFEKMGWIPSSIYGQLFFILLTCILIAIGLIFIIKSNVIMMPTIAFVRVFAEKYGISVGKVKRGSDIVLVIIAVVSSVIYFGEIRGVGVGTLIVALVVGTIMQFLEQKTNFTNSFEAFLAR